MVQAVADAALEENAADLTILDINELTIVADYFVICSGRSIIQNRSIADNVENRLREKGVGVLRKEGYDDGKWIVLDFGSTILHVFRQEERDYYKLEDLWADARGVKPEKAD